MGCLLDCKYIFDSLTLVVFCYFTLSEFYKVIMASTAVDVQNNISPEKPGKEDVASIPMEVAHQPALGMVSIIADRVVRTRKQSRVRQILRFVKSMCVCPVNMHSLNSVTNNRFCV